MSPAITICLIDDDDIYHFVMKKIIEKLKLKYLKKILNFGDGEEALEFITNNISNHSELPNMILLDINMPIMDGWQFMDEYIRLKPRIGKKITIYMVSSSTDVEDINHAKRISEISDYLIKPVTPEQLENMVNSLELA